MPGAVVLRSFAAALQNTLNGVLEADVPCCQRTLRHNCRAPFMVQVPIFLGVGFFNLDCGSRGCEG